MKTVYEHLFHRNFGAVLRQPAQSGQADTHVRPKVGHLFTVAQQPLQTSRYQTGKINHTEKCC